MPELKKQVEEIFSVLSRLKVSGDAVDLMAQVRERLRRLYRGLEAVAGKEAGADGGQDNG